jgi:3-oxoadipate enol-lactonase
MQTIDVNGRTVEYDRTGEGPHLLLLHTLLADASVYDTIMPRLAAQRTVTRLSFPGFGASERGCDSIEAFADWTVEAMGALDLPAETDVFANGFGGFVAGMLAVRHGAGFRRLVLADTGCAFPDPAKAPLRGMAAKVQAEGMEAVLDTAIGRMFPPDFAASAPGIVVERKRRLSQVDTAAFADACLALAALDNCGNVTTIANPVLVVVGLEDQTTPPAMSRQLAEAIPGAQYAEIPGVGHCPQLQDPDGLMAAISEFLDLDAG